MKKEALLKKYGDEESLRNSSIDNDKEILTTEVSELYCEYSNSGSMIKNQEKLIPKTKYMEDSIDYNHKEVWGSYFSIQDNKWGYACCQQLVRSAVCTAV